MPSSRRSPLVDRKTGGVKKLQSLPETLTGRALPDIGYGLQQGLKLYGAALFVGIEAALALGSVALASRAVIGALGRLRERAMFLRDFAPDGTGAFSAYDFANQQGRLRFDWNFGERHPGFAGKFLRMSADAGLNPPPRLLVMDQDMAEKTGPSSSAPARYYGVGSVSSPLKGGSDVILMGQGALEKLDTPQLLARAAQECARLKLKHTAANRGRRGRRVFGFVLSAAIVTCAWVGKAMPVKTALHLVATTAFAGLPLEALRRRRQRLSAERGGVLLTGSAEDSIAAMQMLRKEGNTAIPDHRFSGLTMIGFLPPPDSKGYAALKAFEKANPDYCAQRRSRFNLAAASKDPANTNATAPSEPAPRPAKLG